MKQTTVEKSFTILLHLINSKWYHLRSSKEILQSYINCAWRVLEVSYSLFLLSFSFFKLKLRFIYSSSQKTFLKCPLERFSEVLNILTFVYIWKTKKTLKKSPNMNCFFKTTISTWFWIVAYLYKSVGNLKNLHILYFNIHNLIYLFFLIRTHILI